MAASMLDICRENALLFSEAVCRLQPDETNPFPAYFDWPDHIAVKTESRYLYHLNKTVMNTERIVTLFEPYFESDSFSRWKEDWYKQTLAAAWIHDIGMIADRHNHGFESAALLFDGNQHGFDFAGIEMEDRIKIGLLCLRHNRGWPGTYNGMRDILASHHPPDQILGAFFPVPEIPIWQLEFAGKIISTADSLRYRGRELRNDLRQPFHIWQKCRSCGTMYHRATPFCETINCTDSRLDAQVVVAFDFDHQGYTPKESEEMAVYRINEAGSCERVLAHLSETHAYIRARQACQLYTLGDMALFNVYVEDVQVWRQRLEDENVDYRSLNDLALSATPTYNTVVHVELDNEHPEASFFTFFQYIAAFLDENLAGKKHIPMINENHVLLHIKISHGTRFADFFGKVRAMIKDKSKQDSEQDMEDLVSRFENKLNGWPQQEGGVLPVEVLKNRLEVIKL